LQREDRAFSVKIVRQLESNLLNELKSEVESKKEILLFLDLGSSNLDMLSKMNTDVFVLDHHEITENGKSPNLRIINPHIFNEETSSAGLAYLFVKQLNQKNKDLASLAVIGMTGDMLEKTLSKINNHILKDAEDITIKKGLLIFSATRPLHKALEFSSEIFIPGVTGSSVGAINLLREAGIKNENGKYSSLIGLNQDETSRLITAIMLRRLNKSRAEDSIIGNIYLIKFFNRMEDVRELSTLINACSRLGYSDIALSLCLGDNKARTRAEEIYNEYKHEIIQALNFISHEKKIEGAGYVIINAKSNIKDALIGTVTSILAFSGIYNEGTIIIGMAHQNDKIKASARVVGRENKTINLQRILNSVVKEVGGEGGGHAEAAGCIIPKEKENEFIEAAKKEIERESISIKI
jgi:RecJ-like exonuclease